MVAPIAGVPPVGTSLYQLVDLFDEADSVRVMEFRILKIWKEYVFIQSVRSNGTAGSHRKIRRIDVMKWYALTPAEAAAMAIRHLRSAAADARISAISSDTLADSYLKFMIRKGYSK